MNDRSPPAPSHAENPAPRMWQPPFRVLLAVRLLWISLALGIPSLLLEISRSLDAGSFFFIVVQVGLLAFSVYINISVYRARNWARVVALFLTLLELLVLGIFPRPPDSTAMEIVSNWVSAAMDVAAMYLL